MILTILLWALCGVSPWMFRARHKELYEEDMSCGKWITAIVAGAVFGPIMWLIIIGAYETDANR